MKSTWIKFSPHLALLIERNDSGDVVMKINQRDMTTGAFGDVPKECELKVDGDLAELISKLMMGDGEIREPKYVDDMRGPFYLAPVLGSSKKPKLALHDSNGIVIPMQRDVKYDGPFDEVAQVTITFAIDGRFFRLGK